MNENIVSPATPRKIGPVRMAIMLIAGFFQAVLVFGGVMYFQEALQLLISFEPLSVGTGAVIALFSMLWPVYLFGDVFLRDGLDE